MRKIYYFSRAFVVRLFVSFITLSEKNRPGDEASSDSDLFHKDYRTKYLLIILKTE